MEISESRSILSVTFMCSCKARFSFSASQYCFWMSSRRRNPWGIRKISLFVRLCLEITFKCCLFPFKSGTAANLRPYAHVSICLVIHAPIFNRWTIPQTMALQLVVSTWLRLGAEIKPNVLRYLVVASTGNAII